MGLVQRFAVRQYLKVLRNADQASADELAVARTRLTELGSEALPSLLQLVGEGVLHPVIHETLLPLITDLSLPRVIEVLAVLEGHGADFLEKVLAQSCSYDPRLLFELMDAAGPARPRLERVLRARTHAVRWDSLRTLLRDPTRDRVRVILGMLETRREPQAIQIAQSLLDSGEAWTRLQAIRFLSGGGGEGAAAAVAACLKDKEPTVRRAAATTLGALGAKEFLAPLCQTLRDPDVQVGSSAIAALVKIGDPGAVRYLIEVLKDESEYARRAAVEVLNQVATTEAIEDLVHSLQDVDWWVRVRAADALGALGGDRVVEAILKLVRSEDVFVRRYAIEILNSIPSERSVPALIESLNDQDWWVRERAIDALGKTGNLRAVDSLMLQLRADPQIASLVVSALVKIGEAKSLSALLECLSNPHVAIRETARVALREVARSSADPEVRKGAARALSREGESSEWGRAASRGDEDGLTPGGLHAIGGGDPSNPGDRQNSVLFQAVGATRMEPLLPEVQLRSRNPNAGPIGDPAGSGHAPGRGLPRPRGVDTRVDASGNEPPRRPPSSRTDRNDPEDANAITLIDLPKLPPGTMLLDRYEVLRKIGEGGFGFVYLVMDRSVDEEIILKILAPQISLDETMIKRFVHELKFNRRIVHPNVIRLYDFLELNPGHAISMEYFASDDLGAVLERETMLSPERVLRMAEQICHGLKAAHDSGIVHRDIKPQNVLIGPEDRVKIVDFGVAARSDTNLSRVTKSGILVGTPQYMSPEQIRGTEVDLRTDIYALGALLFECLAGHPPYVSSNPINVLMMHIGDPVPEIRGHAQGVPEVLAWLVDTALAKDPAQRPQRIDDILAEIERKAA